MESFLSAIEKNEDYLLDELLREELGKLGKGYMYNEVIKLIE